MKTDAQPAVWLGCLSCNNSGHLGWDLRRRRKRPLGGASRLVRELLTFPGR